MHAEPKQRTKTTHIVLEATALISYLQVFNNTLVPLRDLQEKQGVCQYTIPDVVFYELTGILPSSLPQLDLDIQRALKEDEAFTQRLNARHRTDRRLREQEKAKLGGGPIQELIDSYVNASPRASMGGGQNRASYSAQLEALMHWYIDNLKDHLEDKSLPRLVMQTETGKMLSDSLQAEHDLLGKAKKSAPKGYMPDHSDLNEIMGSQIDMKDVNLHIGQLMLMGLISEDEYKERMRREEKPTSIKRRFVSFNELMQTLTRHSSADYTLLTKKVDTPTKTAATVKDFLDHIGFLLSYEKLGPNMAELIADPDSYLASNKLVDTKKEGYSPIRESLFADGLKQGDLIKGVSIEQLVNAGVLSWKNMSQANWRFLLMQAGMKEQEASQLVGDEAMPKEVGAVKLTIPVLFALRDRVYSNKKYTKLQNACDQIVQNARPALAHYFQHRMVGQSKIQMGTLVYSGVIPWRKTMTSADKLKLLKVLGYPVIEAKEDAQDSALLAEMMKQDADAMGFYEQYIRLEDLERILDAFSGNPDFGLLERFVHGLKTGQYIHKHEMFSEDCVDRFKGEKVPPYDKPPYIGTPYEKCYSDALMNGMLSLEAYLKLAIRAGKLDHYESKAGVGKNVYATVGDEILLKYDAENPGESEIWVSQDGFYGRAGKTYAVDNNQSEAVENNGKGERLYFRHNVQDLLDKCRNGLHRKLSKAEDYRIFRQYRIFEALLYKAISADASKVHDCAIDVLKEEEEHALQDAKKQGIESDATAEDLARAKLTQIEKDFNNRHIRKWAYYTMPYESMLSGLHITRRIARKNVGEIATAETASKLAEQVRECETARKPNVFIVNHDGDLSFPANRDNHAHQVMLGDHVYRGHSHLKGFLGTAVPANSRIAQNKEPANGTIMQRLYAVSSGEDRNVYMLQTKQWLMDIAKLSARDCKRIEEASKDRQMGKNTHAELDTLKWKREMDSWRLQSAAKSR